MLPVEWFTRYITVLSQSDVQYVFSGDCIFLINLLIDLFIYLFID